LTLSECALLIAIPRSPGKYSPYKHPERAKQRRDFTLQKMLENNLISSTQCEEAINETINVVEQKKEKRIGEYYLEEIPSVRNGKNGHKCAIMVFT